MPACQHCGTELDPLTSTCPRCAPGKAPLAPPPPMPGAMVQAPAPNSGMAIASFILGICGACTGGLGSIVGIILGIVALSQINASRGRLQGKPFAIWGIILSGVTLLLLAAYIIVVALLVIPKISDTSRAAKEASLIANLSIIRTAVDTFRMDTGRYPEKINDLVLPSSPPYLAPGLYKGPYLREMPRNPLAPVTVGEYETTAPPSNPPVAHWSYDPASGKVIPGISGHSTRGQRYEDL